MTKTIIAAVSQNGVIGLNNKLPWSFDYKGDLKRFKELTINKTIVMGRNTYESIGKPLPNRRNIVITHSKIENMEYFTSIPEALDTCDGDVYFIGGAQIYKEAFKYANVIDITNIPDIINDKDAIYFPEIDKDEWVESSSIKHEYDDRLTRKFYYKISDI